MANVVTALFSIALIIAGTLALTGSSLSSASDVSQAWDGMLDRIGERSRTELALITADIQGGGDDVDISLRNKGQTALAGFSSWDVILEYFENADNQDPKVLWLPYEASSPPSSGKWAVTGIYMNASTTEAEVYEPNVLNPGEEMIIRLRITPAIPGNTDNLVTLSETNGVTMAAPFSR